jgi:hypothetical protein
MIRRWTYTVLVCVCERVQVDLPHGYDEVVV